MVAMVNDVNSLRNNGGSDDETKKSDYRSSRVIWVLSIVLLVMFLIGRVVIEVNRATEADGQDFTLLISTVVTASLTLIVFGLVLYVLESHGRAVSAAAQAKRPKARVFVLRKSGFTTSSIVQNGETSSPLRIFGIYLAAVIDDDGLEFWTGSRSPIRVLKVDRANIIGVRRSATMTAWIPLKTLVIDVNRLGTTTELQIVPVKFRKIQHGDLTDSETHELIEELRELWNLQRPSASS
jgi:hypothetical protein